MTEAVDVYRATVEELLDNFRHALVAILPFSDRAKINYRDEETHRDGERLAEGLFDAFVCSPMDSDRARIGDELPLARYDVDVDDYLALSWLASDAESPQCGAVVRFLSKVSPFDAVQVVDLDPMTLRTTGRRTVPLKEIRPALYRRHESGEATIVTHVEAVE